MNREELLKQIKENKSHDELYKEPVSIQTDIVNNDGIKTGIVIYNPKSDTVEVLLTSVFTIEGSILKAVRDAFNRILGE